MTVLSMRSRCWKKRVINSWHLQDVWHRNWQLLQNHPWRRDICRLVQIWTFFGKHPIPSQFDSQSYINKCVSWLQVPSPCPLQAPSCGQGRKTKTPFIWWQAHKNTMGCALNKLPVQDECSVKYPHHSKSSEVVFMAWKTCRWVSEDCDWVTQ